MPNPGVDTVPDEHCQGQNPATSPRPNSPTATTSTRDTGSAEKSHSPEGGQNNVCRCGQEPGTGATNGQTPSQNTDLEDCTGRPVESARAGSCRKYVLKVCRALILFGAPTHRLEQYVHHTGDALDLHIQSFYMPGCMIMSFENQAQESIDLQIIRSTQALNLAKLYDIHTVYKNVIHKKTTVEDAVTQIDGITDRPESFPLWLRVLVYGLASMCIGPVSYNAQPVDLPIIFILGSLVGLSELVLAPKSELYGYVFETCAAILASFIGRAFGSIHWGQDQSFCFSAISQASIVLILPGFAITSSALELQSKNMVSGAVRMVWAIVYTLFLSFGFTIGITIYGAIHHDATSETQCRTTYPVWWPIAFVLPFTFCYVIVNKGNWKQMPPMLGISLAGWCVNHFSSQRFAAVPTISQALGALTVGVLANLYARIEHGMAVALMHPAIYLQVPGSLAASGSLISGLSNADQLNKNGSTDAPREAMFSDLNAGYTMAQIGIAITVGLSISVLLVYPIRKKARSGIFSL